ncbi:uncharacterized [Tachysurus ichikawai]
MFACCCNIPSPASLPPYTCPWWTVPTAGESRGIRAPVHFSTRQRPSRLRGGVLDICGLTMQTERANKRSEERRCCKKRRDFLPCVPAVVAG